jgi:hypothetical protein
MAGRLKAGMGGGVGISRIFADEDELERGMIKIQVLSALTALTTHVSTR